ncbi:MAG: XRE family transcriptional regulator [Candidatus Riflebacteria bacterium]|nr:XRE family transcriptional regulator [Candidatus Riflebacteria bacterium]
MAKDLKRVLASFNQSLSGKEPVREWLKDLQKTTSLSVKRVLAWQIEKVMVSQGITKAKMALRMKTSRSQLDRLLDPDNDRIQLNTLHRPAIALGNRMMISFEDAPAT